MSWQPWLRGLCCATVALAPLGCSGDERPVPTPPPPAAESAPASVPTPPPPAVESAAAPVSVAPPCEGLRLPGEVRKSPIAVETTPELEATREILRRVVEGQGLDPDNPWAIGHALIALGPDAALADGTLAIDHLFAEYAEQVDVAGTSRVRFPRKRGAIRIEPHTDLLLKALAEIGVSPERELMVQGKPHVLGDLVCHSLSRAWVEGDRVSFDSWNDTPWALQGLTTYVPENRSWTAAGGHDMSLDAFTDAVVAKHRSEVQFIHDAMARGEVFQKRKQGIFGYTCGGAHLLQGAAFAVGRGFGSAASRESIRADVSTWFARYAVEMRMLDAAMKQYPEHRLRLVVQRLKFLGHLTESAHKLAAAGLLEPDAAQTRILAAAMTGLVETVRVLSASGVLEQLPALKLEDEQLYLDIIGDSAHALRGLELATGRGSVRL